MLELLHGCFLLGHSAVAKTVFGDEEGVVYEPFWVQKQMLSMGHDGFCVSVV